MGMMTIRPFEPIPSQNTANIAVTGASQVLAVPVAGQGTRSIRVLNSGTQIIFIVFGISTSTAAVATAMPILANSAEIFTLPNNVTHVAVIASATGSTMYITVGEGV